MPTTGFLFDQSKTSPLILFAHCGVIFYEVFFGSRVSPDARGGYGAVGQRACLWPLAVIGRRSRVRVPLASMRDLGSVPSPCIPAQTKKPPASKTLTANKYDPKTGVITTFLRHTPCHFRLNPFLPPT